MLLTTLLLVTVGALSLLSLLVFVLHEQRAISESGGHAPAESLLRKNFNLNVLFQNTSSGWPPTEIPPVHGPPSTHLRPHLDRDRGESLDALLTAILDGVPPVDPRTSPPHAATPLPPAVPSRTAGRAISAARAAAAPVAEVGDDAGLEGEALMFTGVEHDEHEKTGSLTCNGKETPSEVIYWKVVPGDNEYESPITPHHGVHRDRYLTFEYDNAGWNNMRMAMECLIVCAHAMGRTVVLPPYQILHHINAYHKDKNDKEARSIFGFEDFMNVDALRSHKGFHVITMREFLEREALTGGLHGEFPPNNSSTVWGQPLWRYLEKVADAKPAWGGAFIAFPDRPGDFNFNLSGSQHPRLMERMRRFGGSDRRPVFYEEHLQRAHHLHFPGASEHRVLQHHYAFTFFASPSMQSFYKRFIRDYMRYRDEIQCLGHELVQAVRADARAAGVASGDYYALHIRRGDFFKEVKIQASDILRELRLGGAPIVPPGSVVYIATDDPDGVCRNCRALGKGCEEYGAEEKPVGCPKDPSWKAFTDFGWKIRFLKDYMNTSFLKDSNPNMHGMVESIVCSRAKAFAGTWFSTFTGYIHRLRGYHGLGEATYYHSPGHVTQPQSLQSVGHGFSREWRAGWTDDAGELI